MKFNADQQACIECETNLLIVAPPGSGKTGTLVAKAARILRDPGTRVGMVTFTRAAAEEMRHRLAEVVGRDGSRRLFVETFHKHSILQLKSSGKLPRQLTNQEQVRLILQAIDRAGVHELALPDAREQIETAKRNVDFTGEETPLITEYQGLLKQFKAIDLMDLSRLAVLGMRSGTVRPMGVTHLLGDEFQDADQIQLEWMLAHGDSAVLTCVGDDDQAIYGWRGSMGYEGMTQFRDRAGAEHINLQVNYRSRLEIIHASQAVIAHNLERIPKTVLCARGEGGAVSIIEAGSVSHEADLVVDMVLNDLRDEDGELPDRIVVPKGRWAVIARTNFALMATALALRAAAIPYTRAEEKDELEGPFLTLLLMITALQKSDPLTIESALLALGFSQVNLANLHRRMGEDFEAVLEGELPEVLEDFEPEDEKRLRKLSGAFFPAWREKARQGQYLDVVDDVASYIRDAGLLRPHEDPAEFNDSIARLKKRGGSLVSMAMPFLEPRRPDKAGEGVALFTMHGCKGLEFDNVAVIRCNEGLLPSAKSLERLEEERRLFYVAITRARLKLTITSAKGVGDASRFVDHIPGELRA